MAEKKEGSIPQWLPKRYHSIWKHLDGIDRYLVEAEQATLKENEKLAMKEDRVITPEDAPHILKALRWKEDMHVVNDFGEHVWLGPCILNGIRIGITDCCMYDDPCPKHKRIQSKSQPKA